MLLSHSICATIVAFLASQALAKDSKTCHTAMTNKNPGRYVPTKTTTHYTSCTKTSKSTIYTTVTPVYTKTETKYRDTTITKPYGVSTTVKTVIVKTDKITTSTSTATATTTKEVISSSIVPAPEHFIPIQASLPGSTNTNDTMAGPSQQGGLRKRGSPQGYGYGKKTYPKMVLCHEYTADKKHCAVKKVVKKKTVTAYARTTTTTKYAVKTSTKCPGAKETVTKTITSTKFTSTTTVKATTTTTSTSTSIVGTTTVYEACLSSANYANQVSGRRIIEANPIPADRTIDIDQFQVANAFDCCNAAFNTRANAQVVQAPEIFAYAIQEDDANPGTFTGLCTLLGDNACGAGQADGQWEILNAGQAPEIPDQPVEDVEPGPILGNAVCGKGVGPSA